MSRALPTRANLENIEKQARDLLHALRKRDAAALRRFDSLDPSTVVGVPSLAEAQYVIAREYGCASWRKLQERLDPHRHFPNRKGGGHIH
jgi:hypothetical protein